MTDALSGALELSPKEGKSLEHSHIKELGEIILERDWQYATSDDIQWPLEKLQ